MSATVIIHENRVYDVAVRTGRPTTQKRSPFGQRLYEARSNAGISQAQVAEVLGVSQSGYAAWERGRSSPSPEQIEQIATLLKISITSFFFNEKSKRGGPKGKAQVLFEEVSKLPRHQQKHILGTVEIMLAGQRAKAS
jgi:transcriptional regulator with XRE-family HTH domain